jgi:serine protease inhibitor
MDRRTFLALLGMPAFVALLDACGGDDPEEAEMVRSSLTRVAADPALTVDGAAVANGLGHDLYRWLAYLQPEGNLVCSPVSIAVALAMASAGAVGATEAELLTALHSTDPASLHRSMNALTAALDSRSGDDVTLSLANSIWGQDGFAFQQPFLDVLAAEYAAGMQTVDYTGDTEGARRTINTWVEERTNDRIPELIAQGVLTAETRLTLVNAVYLKAPWARPFVEGATEDRPFTMRSGEVVDLPTMALTATLPYSSGDGWVAVELPFAGEQLAMVVLLPEAGYDDYEQNFVVSESIDYFSPTLVTLRLPRFDVGAALSLRSTLEQMGVGTPFSDAADFSAISTDEPLQIAEVAHQANITVDEHGAEAAAATAVVMRVTSAPMDDPIEIVVDRRFIFVVRDRATGTVLFLGRVDDPRGAA